MDTCNKSNFRRRTLLACLREKGRKCLTSTHSTLKRETNIGLEVGKQSEKIIVICFKDATITVFI